MTDKLLLIILDGLGAAKHNRGNAVTLANPTNLMRYWDSYPHTYLQASGEAVGLPDGVYGNSEVGHMNIGAGRVLLQNLPKINKAISKGAYYSNQTLRETLSFIDPKANTIHVIGCFSDGAVHSHIKHFIATLEFYKRQNYPGEIKIHAFTDGRDTHPKSARSYLEQVQEYIDQSGLNAKIVSLCGRAIAMDRNQKWERTIKAYQLLTESKGERYPSWHEALEKRYASDETDEYLSPSVIGNDDISVKQGDVVLYLNFRADRAIQLTDAFISDEFEGFPRQKIPGLFFASMVAYRKDFPEKTLMSKEYVNLSLGRLIAESGKRQLRIAESEKFPHVTYFFNGGNAVKYNGEDRIEIQSPNVPTYDLQPEMSTFEVLGALDERIKLELYDFIVLNIANTDMVGHTGNLEACVKAVKVADFAVKKLVDRFTALGGTVVITADHGNVEEVIKLDTEEPDTEHSLNPVPFIIINREIKQRQLAYGKLADIAPTILDLLGIPTPSEMIGQSLIP